MVLIDPGCLQPKDPTVHTRSHWRAVPCTADIVDKVICTRESLSDRDITKRERLGWSLFISHWTDKPVISVHTRVAVARLTYNQ